MKIFLYDNTFEGLMTSIYECFYCEVKPQGIYGRDEFDVPLLLDEINEVSTDEIKFKKVRDAIVDKIDLLCLKKIYLVYLSNHKEKGMLIYEYLKTAFKLKEDVHYFLNIDSVRTVDEINKRVNGECHKLKGFIRFNCIEDKFLYSSIEPDNDVLELLAEHFKKRFANEYWIIHDVLRQKGIVYDGSSYEIVEMKNDIYESLKNHKDEYLDLWRTYFKSTTIEERRNLRLQRRMMPKRYWKHIFEMNK